MFKTYNEALDYLYNSLPVFQRIGATAYKKDLHNTVALCNALGNPENKLKSIHVAGTNGKGSTSHMLASILQAAGYKTGLYTSPHLKSFRERIRVNGDPVSESFVVSFVNKMYGVAESIQPSFFEMTVGMAFDYFVEEKVDIAVIEVGLGGRLDSTNIITPELSVITNIGWDHKDILGDTLEKIAYEKAGIIKSKVPVVISERQSSIDQVFTDKAKSCNAPIEFASDQYSAKFIDENSIRIWKNGRAIFGSVDLPLRGSYQQKNVCGVINAVEILRSINFNLTDDHVVQGLEKVIEYTGLRGRWEQLAAAPMIICDTAHNVDGMREVVKQLTSMKYQHLHMVIGMVKDKDVSDVLALLPAEATYYFCRASIPRAMEAQVLAEKGRERGLTGVVIPDVNQAIGEAKKNASTSDVIFIGGSTFVVAEIDDL